MTTRTGLGNGCPVFKKCGGCQLQNMEYEDQLRYKQGKMVALLGRYGRVSPILGMENPTHYRCKVQAAFARARGDVISGVHQSSSGRVVPVDACMLEDETADAIIVTIRKLMKSFKLKPYDRETRTGFLRHVLVRRGYYTGQIMVVLVTGCEEFPAGRSFVNALVGRFPEITTVVQNVNKHSSKMMLGSKEITLYGEGYIEDSILDCTFRISPKSFYQVNPQMTTVLYGKALEFMGLSGRETVLDTYCGTGTIGLLSAKKAGKVIGVELNSDAVRDAKWNAERNQAENVEFYTGDAGAFMEDMAESGAKADVVIMDPPRAGSSIRFMRSAVTLGPKRIVYVSCNPETLARDLSYYVKNGYKVTRIQPVDMFPHTNHVECVVLLKREDKKNASTL